MPTNADRSYHGTSGEDANGDWEDARIVVERTQWGPTERQHSEPDVVLRELSSELDGLDFG
jgi:hypothetical protein